MFIFGTEIGLFNTENKITQRSDYQECLYEKKKREKEREKERGN